MIRIEVARVEVRQVVKKATGEIFMIPEVHAYAHGIDKYPKAIKFGIKRDAPHPAPGLYELGPDSFRVGQYDRLELNSVLELKPVTAGTSAVRAAA